MSALEEASDAATTVLYRRFKDWSQRGFGPDDVTWCEVRAELATLIAQARAEERELCLNAIAALPAHPSPLVTLGHSQAHDAIEGLPAIRARKDTL